MFCVPQVVDIHHGQNPIIILTGVDSAEGVWDIFYYNINLADRTTLQLAGFYNDLYVRIDGKWVMSSTVFRRTSILTTSISEDGSIKCSGIGRGQARAPGENWAA